MESDQQLTIHVMLPTGSKISYSLPMQTTAGNLIDKLNTDPQVTIPENKTISIIYRGKILKPSDVLSSFDELTEFSVQLFFRQKNKNSEEIKIRTLTGFDRLARMNYTPEQIQEYRDSFHDIHNSADLSESARLDLEEEWFPIIFNSDNPGEIIELANRMHNVRSTTFRRRHRQRHPSPPPQQQPQDNDESHTTEDTIETPLLQQETENNNNAETHNAGGTLMEDENFSFSPTVEFTLGVVLGLILGFLSVGVVCFNFERRFLVLGIISGLTLNILLESGI